ncbi:MAG: hypothetical protein JRJ84_10330 [Deltaproteobacteria bacterium]|nr:hypothetical protein [Deltaproteobacteria bacterium]
MSLPRAMVPILVLGLFTAVLQTPDAHAQTEVCSSVYTHDQLFGDMNQVDRFLGDLDIKGAKRKLSDTRRSLRCIDQIVQPSYLARFGRQMALIFFFDQDEDATRRWGLLARYSDASYPWASEHPSDHPYREQVETSDDPILGGPRSASLAPPTKGGIFMNGHLLTRPEAPAEVPMFMQVADKKGIVIASFWQDGARFPEVVLGPAGPEPAPPKWWTGSTPAPAPAVVSVEPDEPTPRGEPEPGEKPRVVADAEGDVRVDKPPRERREKPERTRPEPTGGGGIPMGRVAVSGGLLAASGTFAILAAISHGALWDAETTDDLASIRSRTNVFGMTSGIAALAAVGVGVTVLLEEDGLGLGIAGRF